MGEQLAFYVLSFLLVGSAVMAVTVRNIFHAAIWLILALTSVAGLFVMLQAEFLAAVQVLVYVGGVAMIMIFAVMLTSKIADVRVKAQNEQVGIGLVVCFVLFLTLAFTLWNTNWPVTDIPMASDNVRAIGRLIMTTFVLPFEIVSVLLLAAMIGAIVIASKQESKNEEDTPS